MALFIKYDACQKGHLAPDGAPAWRNRQISWRKSAFISRTKRLRSLQTTFWSSGAS